LAAMSILWAENWVDLPAYVMMNSRQPKEWAATLLAAARQIP
jgi:hypothetical protein